MNNRTTIEDKYEDNNKDKDKENDNDKFKVSTFALLVVISSCLFDSGIPMFTADNKY